MRNSIPYHPGPNTTTLRFFSPFDPCQVHKSYDEMPNFRASNEWEPWFSANPKFGHIGQIDQRDASRRDTKLLIFWNIFSLWPWNSHLERFLDQGIQKSTLESQGSSSSACFKPIYVTILPTNSDQFRPIPTYSDLFWQFRHFPAVGVTKKM